MREVFIRWNSSPQDVAEADIFLVQKQSHKVLAEKPQGLKHRNTTSTLKSLSHVLGVEIILEEEHHCIIVLFIHHLVTLRARIRPDGSRV